MPLSKDRVLAPDGKVSGRAVQFSLDKIVDTLNDTDALSGNKLIKDISVSTSTTKIKHGLGKEVTGYFVVKADWHVTVYLDVTNPRPTTELWLVGSANATISLIVF